MPGPEHASEIMSWGAFALVGLSGALALAWFLLLQSWRSHARKLDEIVQNNREANSNLEKVMGQLSAKFDVALERMARHDTQLAVQERRADEITSRMGLAEGEIRIVSDRYHSLMSQIQGLILKTGLKMREADGD